jgi:hypothetical protein
MRPPRDDGRLSTVRAASRARAMEEARSLGWAEGEVRRGREERGRHAELSGLASAVGPEVGRRPGKAENSFFFYK